MWRTHPNQNHCHLTIIRRLEKVSRLVLKIFSIVELLKQASVKSENVQKAHQSFEFQKSSTSK